MGVEPLQNKVENGIILLNNNSFIRNKEQYKVSVGGDITITEKKDNSKKATPFKKKSDIEKMISYFKDNGKYRDLCLFVLGINVGLRCSDLIRIRVSDIVDEDGFVVDRFKLTERKTANTKGRGKNYIDINALTGKSGDELVEVISKKASKKKVIPKAKTVYLNNSAKQAIQKLINSRDYNYNDYLFYNDSNNSKIAKNNHLTVGGVNYILNNAVNVCGISDVHASSHSLRKTFGYHFYMQNCTDPRCLLKLQKIFNHSSATTTLEYIGITDDEIQSSWDSLNLGL